MLSASVQRVMGHSYVQLQHFKLLYLIKYVAYFVSRASRMLRDATQVVRMRRDNIPLGILVEISEVYAK